VHANLLHQRQGLGIKSVTGKRASAVTFPFESLALQAKRSSAPPVMDPQGDL